MACALPPPTGPLIRQLSESKWESGEKYLQMSNATRCVVKKDSEYEYVVIKINGRVWRITHYKDDIHASPSCELF